MPVAGRVSKSRSGELGFSLVEVAILITVVLISLYALSAGTNTSIHTRRAVEREYAIQLQALDYLQRLRRIPFGRSDLPLATGAQLDELFDDDAELGSAALSQLRVPHDEPGHAFKVNGGGFRGTWRIKVCTDLDNNGDIAGDREDRSDLLRINVYFSDRLVLETLRAAEVTLTVHDTGVNYLGGGRGGGGDDDDDDDDG